MRIVVLGAGGVGGYLGARLWKAGHQVVFIARGKHLAAMKQHGLLLESPQGDILVNSIFSDTLSGQTEPDLVIVTVKSFDTKSAADLILPAIGKNTVVLSFQNGVENEDLLKAHLGQEHVIGGVAYIFSTITRPGIIKHQEGASKFKFGELNDKISLRCQNLEQIFLRAGIEAKQTDHIQRSIWEKWIFICGLAAMTAYSKKGIGEILFDNKLSVMLADLIQEAAVTARLKIIDAFEGVEKKVFAHYKRLPPNSRSSMYYDLMQGKRLEIDALCGAVVRFGIEFNIPTPVNKYILDKLKNSTV